MNTPSFSNLKAWNNPKIKNIKANASHPWSKSCPNGELDFVLLACFPSIASNVEYMKMDIAENKKHHLGIS